MSRPTLDELFNKHHSDKGSQNTANRDPGAYPTHTHHNYAQVYEPLLEPLRDQPITLLELGYAAGASAQAWAEYFTKARIIMIDNNPEQTCDIDGVELIYGDQADWDLMNDVHHYVGDFDVVIDDASHISNLTIRTFENIYHWLRPGGIYITEDTHSSYHSFHYGQDQANENPYTPIQPDNPTAMQYFTQLANEVNFHGDGEWDLFPHRYWKRYSIESITFHFNLCVIRKAVTDYGLPKT